MSISGVPSPAREADPVDVLALHTALSDLAELDARQAEIVEMRFFAGLTVEEIAEVLEHLAGDGQTRVGDREALAAPADAGSAVSVRLRRMDADAWRAGERRAGGGAAAAAR